MSSEETLRVTAAWRVSAASSRNKRNETGNYRRVYFGNEGSGNGKGGPRKEPPIPRVAAKFRSRRFLYRPLQEWNPTDIYACERGADRHVCVRRIIRRLRSRNNRSEFRVNRFAADTFSYVLYVLYVVYGKFQTFTQKKSSRNFDSSNRSSVQSRVSPFAFPNLDRCRPNRRRLFHVREPNVSET